MFSILSRKARVRLLVAATFVLSFAAAVLGWAATQPSERMWDDIDAQSLDPAVRRLIDPKIHRIVRLDTGALARALEGAPMEFSGKQRSVRSSTCQCLMARWHGFASRNLRSWNRRSLSSIRKSRPTADRGWMIRRPWCASIGRRWVSTLLFFPARARLSSSRFHHRIPRPTSRISIATFPWIECRLPVWFPRQAAQRGFRFSQGMDPSVFVTGSTLRTYRLAVAATGEFTQQYGGGNVNKTLAQITTLINQVSAIYRREATITFQLIANETSIIFTDPATDGYTNNSPSAMLAENQTKLTTVIGPANYDIGHVFGGITVGPGSVAFAGVASIGVVCNGTSKGRGVTTMGGGSSSFPHSIFVSGLAHEIGHQFSARHTFNSTTGGCVGPEGRDGRLRTGQRFDHHGLHHLRRGQPAKPARFLFPHRQSRTDHYLCCKLGQLRCDDGNR